MLKTSPCVGYWVEYRPGDPCLYSVSDFARESQRSGGEIRGLYLHPQAGCAPEPAAYLGRFWHRAKYYGSNAKMDPDAVPLYLGQVLHDPARHEAIPS